MREPLQYVTEGSDKPNYVRVYECEHLTDGTYPRPFGVQNILHVGEHASIALCKHCWQHVTGMVLQEMVQEEVRKVVRRKLEDIVGSPIFMHKLLRELDEQEKAEASEA